MITALDYTDWDRTAWCGPSVIATLTGVPVKTATEMIARMNGKTAEKVEGTYEHETIHALNSLGYSVRKIDLAARYNKVITVGRFLRDRSVLEKAFPVMMVVNGRGSTHICAAHYSYFCDSWTKIPVPIQDMPKPRRLIFDAWIVQKTS